jgi:hypothetical protein
MPSGRWVHPQIQLSNKACFSKRPDFGIRLAEGLPLSYRSLTTLLPKGGLELAKSHTFRGILAIFDHLAGNWNFKHG